MLVNYRTLNFFRSINCEDALLMPGVHCYVGANDMKPNCNSGCIEPDTEIFATEEVYNIVL